MFWPCIKGKIILLRVEKKSNLLEEKRGGKE